MESVLNPANPKAKPASQTTRPAPLAWSGLLVLFGVPTLFNLVACQLAIPFLVTRLAWPSEAAYFAAVGILVLAPMFFAALYLGRRELKTSSAADLMARLRLRSLSAGDWIWTIGGFVGLCLASLALANWVLPLLDMPAKPFFFQNMPFDAGHRWLLVVWSLYFFFNIFGEELYWRGYILPRQEGLNGGWTWAVQGLLWAIWHLPMGVGVVVSTLPTLFILPAIAQIRKNTAITLIIHAVFGAMGFLTLAFGLIG
jgi:membrane protease YdiL (CAAX protease family)